eukprot:UN23528
MKQAELNPEEASRPKNGVWISGNADIKLNKGKSMLLGHYVIKNQHKTQPVFLKEIICYPHISALYISTDPADIGTAENSLTLEYQLEPEKELKIWIRVKVSDMKPNANRQYIFFLFERPIENLLDNTTSTFQWKSEQFIINRINEITYSELSNAGLNKEADPWVPKALRHTFHTVPDQTYSSNPPVLPKIDSYSRCPKYNLPSLLRSFVIWTYQPPKPQEVTNCLEKLEKEFIKNHKKIVEK